MESEDTIPPKAENLLSVNPISENRQLLSNNRSKYGSELNNDSLSLRYNKRENKTKEKRTKPDSKKHEFTISSLDGGSPTLTGIFLADEELRELVLKFGAAGAANRIEQLSTYKVACSKEYASDYAEILRWSSNGLPSGSDRFTVVGNEIVERPLRHIGWHISDEWLAKNMSEEWLKKQPEEWRNKFLVGAA